MFECWVCLIHGTVFEEKLDQRLEKQQYKVLEYDKREYWPILKLSAESEYDEYTDCNFVTSSNF